MATRKKLRPGTLERYRIIRESVSFISSDLFFASGYQLPDEKISDKSLGDIVSLSLETSSPFQEDDMFYGFFVNRKNGSVFIYSTLRERIVSSYSDSDYMFPEFLPALLINTGSEDVVFKRNNRMIVIEKIDGSFFGIRSFDDSKDLHLPVVELRKYRVVISEGIKLFVTITSNGNVTEQKTLLSFKNKEFWWMELHDRYFNSARSKAKVLQLLSFDCGVLAALVATAAFLFLSGIERNVSKETSISRTLADKEKIVKMVKEKNERLHELDSFAKKRQIYFKMLNDVNRLRPDKISFKSVKGTACNKLEISAVAKMEIKEVNAYTDKLSELDSLRSVKCIRPVTSGGQTTFSIVLEAKES
ncbi:MAG: hypothetical protein LBB20_02790 [Puniceicoccales bacterium]|jgi:Tfp pilus assembly protein PilN|nr:hypothetical protein [Puniceicoccales bacterium]